jgi:hypothetical protein
MLTPNNLEEGKPVQPLELETEATTEDSIKYIIKISSADNKLTVSTSYKKGLICKQYFSSFDLEKLLENQHFAFKNLDQYLLFLKDILDNNKLLKIDNKIKNENGTLILDIPAKLGIIKEMKFQIKEKEMSEKENQKNIMEFLNKIYLENEELKKKVDSLTLENEKIKTNLEETKKKLEQNDNIKKKVERIKNLFKDSAIVKADEKKMINDWIDPYDEKNITSELLFRTNVDGDNSNTFHSKCDGKGATITFIKTTAGKRLGGFAALPWTNNGGYKADSEAFIFSLDACQKFVQYRYEGNAVYQNSSYGPTFGSGHDLYLATGCKSNNNSYCNSNYSYGFYYSYNLINPGSQTTNFQVTDYEVYLVKINK